MKKIVIAMTAMLVAVAVNAGSVNWQSGNISALPNFATDWQGNTAYCFLVESAAYDLNPLISSLSGGGAFDSTGADLSKAVAGAPFYLQGTGSAVFTDGSYAYGYAILFNDAGTQFAISSVKQSAVFASGANSTLNLGGGANFTVYDVVPEPTSMALLAMGIAAVGLRRRFRK